MEVTSVADRIRSVMSRFKLADGIKCLVGRTGDRMLACQRKRCKHWAFIDDHHRPRMSAEQAEDSRMRYEKTSKADGWSANVESWQRPSEAAGRSPRTGQSSCKASTRFQRAHRCTRSSVAANIRARRRSRPVPMQPRSLLDALALTTVAFVCLSGVAPTASLQYGSLNGATLNDRSQAIPTGGNQKPPDGINLQRLVSTPNPFHFSGSVPPQFGAIQWPQLISSLPAVQLSPTPPMQPVTIPSQNPFAAPRPPVLPVGGPLKAIANSSQPVETQMAAPSSVVGAPFTGDDALVAADSKKKKKMMKKKKKMEKKHKEWKKGKKHKKKKYESKKKKGGMEKKKKGKKEKKKWGMEKKGHKKKGNFKKKKWGSKKKMKKGHKKGKKGHKMLKDKGHKKKGFKKVYHKEEWGKKKKWHDIKREKKWNTKQKKWKKKWHQEKGKKYKGKHMKKYHKKNKHGKKYKKEKKSKYKKHKGEKFKKGHKKKKEEYSKKKEGGKKKKMKKMKKEMKKKKG